MATTTVNIHQAKTNLSRLIAQVESGEEVIIARSGKPAARLISTASAVPGHHSWLGFMKGSGSKVPDDFNEMGHAEVDEMFYGGLVKPLRDKPEKQDKKKKKQKR